MSVLLSTVCFAWLISVCFSQAWTGSKQAGQDCVSDAECGPGMQCMSSARQCKCRAGYIEVQRECKLNTRKIGSYCNRQDDCPSEMRCSANQCNCLPNMQVIGDNCLPQIPIGGGVCSLDQHCTYVSAGSSCVGGQCLCPTMTVPIQLQTGVKCLGNANEVCRQGQHVGICSSQIVKFWYNYVTGNCESFVYSGCGGNWNNFDSATDCYQFCGLGYQNNKDSCYPGGLRKCPPDRFCLNNICVCNERSIEVYQNCYTKIQPGNQWCYITEQCNAVAVGSFCDKGTCRCPGDRPNAFFNGYTYECRVGAPNILITG